ncbi:7,8-dihydropterin-6-yl-methyl-4-(beta-D-ribofuranosyl)aminobenzene 5'-phosphate synthase [Clostridium moniliforme]|uniref:7, 8-dihydropterin-6-yl-methyl-4-(Beta-D-ribofuranosyl)aminobenzene 5'-phosphate synthase n=1 Tax=Clostridium moniliforme TaxID=39489 RepID=A0ABS4EXS6_9CLOT|nr:MBL fold metallo-hydrolase [Clostridium moniliforme]MBP1888647.1 7,8-dihydropterin-6-yl-methyl-4-(beta-D-ribofuranosyl)aminobenzene 5'-phosphate synthase [Clostridium moniliforme]
MKITTVIENNKKENSNLKNEHGLCYFIEEGDLKILFDTGQTKKALSNFNKLNLPLEKIDYIILSHAHYDHAGGFKYFINSIENKPMVIIGANFFNRSNKYHLKNGYEKYIGINFDEKFLKENKVDYKEIYNIFKIGNHMYAISNLQSFKEEEINLKDYYDILYRKDNGIPKKDNFKEEIVLVIEKEEGIVLITGCAHTGIINSISKVQKIIGKKVIEVIGGIHLSKNSLEENMKVSEELKKLNIKKFSLCHCSGEKIINILKNEGNKVIEVFTGSVIK